MPDGEGTCKHAAFCLLCKWNKKQPTMHFHLAIPIPQTQLWYLPLSQMAGKSESKKVWCICVYIIRTLNWGIRLPARSRSGRLLAHVWLHQTTCKLFLLKSIITYSVPNLHASILLRRLLHILSTFPGSHPNTRAWEWGYVLKKMMCKIIVSSLVMVQYWRSRACSHIVLYELQITLSVQDLMQLVFFVKNKNAQLQTPCGSFHTE